jgi:DNA-binding PadR family transcriptional regulator
MNDRRMTIRSPVSWAVLGLIIERPSYGYELFKRFERIYTRRLPIRSESHIYRALDALEVKGLIEQIPATYDSRAARQPRPRYRATRQGVDGYCAWLEAKACDQTLPSEVFACALAALVHQPDVALRIVDCCEQAYFIHANEPGRTGRSKANTKTRVPLAERLSSEERRLALEARLPWIRYARCEFEELTTPPPWQGKT